MASKHRESKEPGVRPGLLVALRVLVGAALAISVYLAWVSLTSSRAVGCGPQSGCDAVLKSRWAYWLGVPVSLPAIGVYALFLGMTLCLGPARPAEQRRRTWQVMIFLGALIAGAAVWFVVVQAGIIHRFCPFCMTAHGCGLAAALLVLRGAPIRGVPESHAHRQQQVYVAPGLARRIAGAAAAGVVVLVAGQCLQAYQTFAVKSLNEGAARADVERVLTLHDGAFKFNLRETPLMGSPDASNVIVSLFDYTCQHCQHAHGAIRQAQDLFSNRLAVLSLPMPLSSNCNTSIKYPHPRHAEACEYAKLGLAVWRADRARHREFDDWLFATYPPRSLETARAQAAQWVGTNALQKALQDPWITNILAQGMALHATNWLKLQVGALPELVIGSNVIAGVIERPQILESLRLQLNLTTNSPVTPPLAGR